MIRTILGAVMAALIVSLGAGAYAQDDRKIDRMTTDAMTVFKEDTIEWNDEPLLPKGAKSALVIGNPGKAGVFMAYLKFPANYVIPPHTHPFAEVVTVLKGQVGNGMGETFDAQKGELLDTGASFTLPAGHAHYLWNKEEAVVLLVATGPWNITYIDPKDDPRGK